MKLLALLQKKTILINNGVSMMHSDIIWITKNPQKHYVNSSNYEEKKQIIYN